MTCPVQILVIVEVNLHIPKSRLVKNSFVVRSLSLSRKRSWKSHKPVQLPERQGSCTNLTQGRFLTSLKSLQHSRLPDQGINSEWIKKLFVVRWFEVARRSEWNFQVSRLSVGCSGTDTIITLRDTFWLKIIQIRIDSRGRGVRTH